MARYGVIGSGDVGKTLARGLKGHGHDVRIGSRDGKKLAAWSREQGIEEGNFAAVAEHAETVVLAVAGGAAEEAVKGIARSLGGKVVVDTTNPIGGPPVNGILPFFTGANESLMERLQGAVPTARFVKAFSCVGNALMVDPTLPGGRPTMFIAGNDAEAKREVTALLDQFGWDVEDVGGMEGARAIEPLSRLWCAPGFLRNDWAHAYRVLRP
jgi:8-hydroxy-5-deazaflavin:NADPH oxidoreductase